jgi:hypothetical protein
VRGSEPDPAVAVHGASSYKHKGCRCFVCTRGHAEEQNRYNERKRRRGTLPVSPWKNAGRVEITTLAQIEALAVSGPEADMVVVLAHMNARFIDTISVEGRLHLMSGAQRSLLETMDRLRALSSGGVAPDERLSSPGSP